MALGLHPPRISACRARVDAGALRLRLRSQAHLLERELVGGRAVAACALPGSRSLTLLAKGVLAWLVLLPCCEW
jgi:hypothetical protein